MFITSIFQFFDRMYQLNTLGKKGISKNHKYILNSDFFLWWPNIPIFRTEFYDLTCLGSCQYAYFWSAKYPQSPEMVETIDDDNDNTLKNQRCTPILAIFFLSRCKRY